MKLLLILCPTLLFAITLPKGHIVVGNEDDKADKAIMSGVTRIDHTGKVTFSEEGKEQIKSFCREVLEEEFLIPPQTIEVPARRETTY